jgi:hypothetical protein
MKKNDILKKYHKQVRVATVKMLNRLLRGDTNFATLLAPMQSGKTEYIACFFELVRIIYPQALGLYVTSHNHLEFVQQNWDRLEHLEPQDLYCLTLRERKLSLIKNRPLSTFTNQPVFTLYDESHFGDGAKQTIHQWLIANRLYPAKQIFFVGISATPFSSYSIGTQNDTLINFERKDMPSYKSVSFMLRRGLISEATPLILESESEGPCLDEENEAFKCLKKHVRKNSGGYAIIRTRKAEEAFFLESEFYKRFPKHKIFVKHWNMGSQIENPKEYFSNFKPGIFIIVLVQQKARLGSTIPTDYIRFVHEYSPKGTVATISQSLMGRCCGHGKLKHPVQVFTHLRQAEAYSLFECGKYAEFADFIKKYRLKPSQRSRVSEETLEAINGDFKIAPRANKKEIISLVRDRILKEQGSVEQFRPIVRSWSTNKKDRPDYEQIIAEGKNPALNKESGSHGFVSIFYDNRERKNRVYFSYKTDVVLRQRTVVGSDDSFFSDKSNF